MTQTKFRIIAAVLLLSSALVTVTSLIPGVDWARFDRTSSVGPLDYTLSADFDAVGFEYSILTRPSENGGGMIGGVGGGVGSNVTREEEWRSYPQVNREVLENLGVVYDSYSTKSFQFELLMRDPPRDSGVQWDGSGSPSAKLNISLETDLVPFWPSGGTRPLVVNIGFIGADLEDQVTPEQRDRLSIDLNRIRILARTGYDRVSGEYLGEEKLLREMDVEKEFNDIGEKYSRSVDIRFPEDEEAVGFLVEIEASMTDYWGREERAPLSGKANPINIRPVDRTLILRGAGIALSSPLLMISIMISLVSGILILTLKREFIGLVISASALSLVGPLWYFLGITAAVDILSDRLSGAEEGLTWGPGLFIALGALLLSLAALGILITTKLINNRSKTGDEAIEKDGVTFRRIPQDSGVGDGGAAAKTPDVLYQQHSEKETENIPPMKSGGAPPPPPKDPLG